MRGLGRLIALPWLLVALALQGLAPAQAQAMPRDAFGLPICSAHEAERHQHDPSRNSPHDCCAAACALAAIGAAPAPQTGPARRRHGISLSPPGLQRSDARPVRSVWRATARGPPPSLPAV